VGESRRTTDEVRRLILDAAAELFGAQGYARTSHREIAAKAGTAESMIFRNFGTKAELFRQAVLEPFNRHLEQFSATWNSQLQDRVSGEEIFRLFITGLYDLAMQHRNLLLALMAVSQFEGEGGAEIDFNLVDLIAEGRRMLAVEAQSRGWPEIDFTLATKSTIAAIVGMGLLDPWVNVEGEEHSNRAEVIDELVALCHNGIARRPRP
jgi:AcrR family transcriptional regulator